MIRVCARTLLHASHSWPNGTFVFISVAFSITILVVLLWQSAVLLIAILFVSCSSFHFKYLYVCLYVVSCLRLFIGCLCVYVCVFAYRVFLMRWRRFAPDNAWFINTMNQVFAIGGDLVKPEVAHNLLRLIAEGTVSCSLSLSLFISVSLSLLVFGLFSAICCSSACFRNGRSSFSDMFRACFRYR